MKILFINRKKNSKEQSIEKLFGFIIPQIRKYSCETSSVDDPYGPGLKNMFKSMLFFRKQKIDGIVHMTGQVHYSILFIQSKKIVLTIHDLGLYRPLSRVRRWMFLLFWVYLPFKRAQIITVISNKTRDEILSFMPSVAPKIRVIPNCLTTEIVSVEKIKNVIPEILIVGTRSNKNLDRSIVACIGLDINLTIVGELSVEHVASLRQGKINYQCYSYISEEQLEVLYKRSDILLFPSLYEGFGLPILEAQAKGVIPITSNISPLTDTAGYGAIFVEPLDVMSIKNGILRIINMSELEKQNYRNLGIANLKRFSAESIAEAYYEVYKTL